MKKLLISTQSGGWFDEEKPYESMKFIKECGFEAIDFGVSDYFNKSYDKEKLTSVYDNDIEVIIDHYRPIKAAAEEFGIKFCQSHGVFPIYFDDNPEKTEYLIKVTEKMMAVCEFLSCPSIVIHPVTSRTGEKPDQYEKEKAYNFDQYRRLMPAAKKYNVMVCLENSQRWFRGCYYEGPCTDVKEVCEYIDALNEEAGEKLFGFCFDVGHANVNHRDIYRYVVELGDRLTCLHIHENIGMQDSHAIPYTQRDSGGYNVPIDWNKFINALRDINYTGAINFETFGGVGTFPVEVRPAALTLVSSIGRYFKKCIEQPGEE